MRRTPILLLAGLSILLAVGNVLQWRDRPTDDENREIRRDLERTAQSILREERFLVTNNPGGYLKRVDAGTRRTAQGDPR
jgi:hypothetical protein